MAICHSCLDGWLVLQRFESLTHIPGFVCQVIALDRTVAKVSIVVRHAEELGLHNVR
jgi:hypothetical protein